MLTIEEVKAAIEAVKKRLTIEYQCTPHMSKILDDMGDTIIMQLENGPPIYMTDEQVERLRGNRE